MSSMRIAVVSGLLAAAVVSFGDVAQGRTGHAGGGVAAEMEIGTVDFRVSCDEGVREDFDRALGQMHHMMYAQARSQFEAIARTEPDCAMAWWGIATTRFQPLWPTRPDGEALQRGWREIRKAAELEPATTRERLLVDATAAFFRDPGHGDYRQRIAGWAAGMAAAYEAAPDDLDTAALYALSRLALAQAVADRDPLHDEAERILRDVWRAQPKHPGAIHYIIHATDADGRAENALEIVEQYGEIAPRVPHALHMPTHIYVRLGAWPKVIDWNRRSAAAALEHSVDGAVSHHYLHAMDYLLYAYLQQGDDANAGKVFEEATGRDRHQASSISAFHLAAMPARLAVERRRWDEAVALEPATPGYLPWDSAYWPLGLTWFARGLGSVHEGDLARARVAERRLVELRDEADAAGESLAATYIEVDRRILAGSIAHERGDADRAEELMRSAGELESTVEKPPVSPGAVLPPHEALGDMLLAAGRPEQALQAYRRSDEIWPGRFNTLLGAARAAGAAGDRAAAREYYERLLQVATDSDRPALDEARRILGD